MNDKNKDNEGESDSTEKEKKTTTQTEAVMGKVHNRASRIRNEEQNEKRKQMHVRAIEIKID